MSENTPLILVADDDDDDVQFLKQAIIDTGWTVDLRRVCDGEELLDYLYHRKNYSDTTTAPTPQLIILDLNMPKKTGGEVLDELKNNESLNYIPVVVLTTSTSGMDINAIYRKGGNALVSKPIDFKKFVQPLRDFWFSLAQLPLP